MTFRVESWPTPDRVDDYAADMNVSRDAVVRDIVRLVCIARMSAAGDLGPDHVLTGGMAMRLRGSPRFTITDTDTSRRITEPPDRERLAEALTVDDDAELAVRAADPLGWKGGKQIVTARPVEFEAFFATIGEAPTDSFTFTVSWRGVIEPSQPVDLRHPYPELIMPRTVVHLMDLTEQVAEKIVGWCAHGLMKHYADVAWAYHNLPSQIDSSKLGRLVDAKLEVGRRLFPAAYDAFPDREAIRPALEAPDTHRPPLGDTADDGARQIRLVRSPPYLNGPQTRQVVREHVIPALFP